jgi:hypothetical protein
MLTRTFRDVGERHPASHATFRLEIGDPLFRSVLECIAGAGVGREWVARAACARGPASRLTWVLEPNNGIETPASVLRCFDVCSGCPVRVECLRAALGELEIRVYGCWGGSTMTERLRVRTQVAREADRSLAELREHPEPWWLEETARRLEATFDERYAWWVERARARRLEYRRRQRELAGPRHTPPA